MQDSEETIHSAEFFLPHMKAFSLAIEKNQNKFFFEKPNNKKPKIKNLNKCHFQGFTNIQFTIMEQFLQKNIENWRKWKMTFCFVFCYWVFQKRKKKS